MPYNVIVVGTDGSERAAVAVTEALGLAKDTGAKLHVVHAVHPAVEAGYTESKTGQLTIDKAREGVKGFERALLAEADRQGVSAEVHNPGTSDPADALIDAAESLNADVVVVGNKGTSGVKRFVLGSVPNKVAQRCPCSVMIVNTDPS
ncbi:MAG: universal stress protein [Acidimicrobiales bacterium]